MRGGERVAFALVLALLNLLALMLEGGNTLIPSGFIIWVISFVAGYVSGKSGDVGMIASEPLSLIAVAFLRPGLWSSINYLIQTLGIVAAIYSLGVASGLTFRSAGLILIKPSVTGLRAAIPPFLGALGINLVTISAYLGINEVLSLALPMPSDSGLALLLTLGALTSYAASYSLSVRGVNYFRNLVVSGLISIPSPITLPLAVALQPEARLVSGPPSNWVPLGVVGKVFKGGSTLRDGLVYLRTELGLNNHLVVVGSTGTGKTYLVKNLVNHLRRSGINVVILDFHGEYSGLTDSVIDPRAERINVLNLLGSDPRTRAEELADEIARNYRLGNLQRAALHELLIRAYEEFGASLTPHHLEELLRDEGFINKLSLSKEVIRSLLPYLSALGTEGIRWIEPRSLLEGVTSVNLSAINSLPLQQLLAESIIDSIYYSRKNEPGITFLVIEEAHRLLAKREGLSALRVFREGRKFGLSAVAVFQDPAQIDSGILNNASHIITFRISDENSRNKALRTILVGQEYRRGLAPKISKLIASLEVGEAVAKVYDGLYLIKVLTS